MSAAKPTANYGRATRLKAEQSPVMTAYMRFQPSAMSGTITRATLRLYGTNKSSLGYDVRGVADNTWQESTITYANAPAPSTTRVGSSGRYGPGTWTSVDVTPLIAAGAPTSFAVTTASGTALALASRESGGTSPALLIETAAVPDTSAPSAPTNVVAGAATATSVALTWAPSADDVGVGGYGLYVDGVHVGATTETSYTFSGLTCGSKYALGVDAYDAAGNRSLPTTTTVMTADCADTVAPSTATTLTIGSVTQSSVSMSWGASFDNVGVAGYDLYVDGSKAGTTTNTTYTLTSLTCGTRYTFGVVAFDAAGNRSPIASAAATTAACSDVLAPSAPTGVTITATTASSISVAWRPSTDDVGVSGYRLSLDDAAVGTSATTSYTFSGLACGTTHKLAIDAYDAAGNHSPQTTTAASTTACPPPAGAQIKYRFAYSNRLDQNLMPGYGYNLIDVSTKSEADATPSGTLGQVWLYDYDNTTCSWEKDDTYIRNMVSSMADDPKVAGFYFANESDPIKCPNAIQQHRDRNALIKSLAPTKYTILAVDSNWREHFATQVPMWKGVADYLVYNPYICYVGKPCDYAWLDTVLKSAEANGNPYFIALQAFAEGTEWRWPTPDEERQMLERLKDPSLTLLRGYMTFSWNWSGDRLANHPDVLQVIKDFNLGTTASADTTPPTQPSALSVTSATQTSVSLSWTASTDNVGVTAYDVYRNGAAVGTTTSTGFSVTGLACGTTYTFGVAAKDAAGNVSSHASLNGSTAACSSGGADTTPPTTPAALAVTGATTSSVAVTWAASTDDVGIAGYHVYRNGTLVGSTAAVSYTFAGLTCGTSYSLSVDAYDAAGNRSAQASLTAATTACPDSVAPTAPSNLTITGATTSTIALSWGASFDAVGVAGYDVFRNGAKVATTTGTTYSVGGLSCETTYTLAVAAFDAAGNRSASSSVVGATSACAAPDAQAPSAPASVAKAAATTSSVSISWSAGADNVGVTGYAVYSNGTQVGTTTATSYTFTGLSCGTSYTFGVEAYDAAGNRSSRSTVTASTDPCAPAPGDPVVTAAGDLCSSATDCAGTAKLIDAIAPARVIPLGDNAYPDGTSSDYTSFYEPNWGRFKAKTSPAPGNHDYHTAAGAGYFGYFGSQAPAAYYSFDVGAWHVISLNGEIGVSAGSAQETWLKNDLAAHPAKCTLAYWHEPRFSSGAEHGSNSSFDPFWRDLYAAGADIVLNGHDHVYERFAPQNPAAAADPNGIREFVVGTGGASHYTFGAPVANSEVRDNTSFGVLKLTLHAASYDWQFVPVAGASFTDSGSTACH